jgi:hypothetical protein
MIFPGPSFVPVVTYENLDDFMSEFEGVPNVAGGVAVYGSAAAYALVWELGSRRLKQPGPKTLWAVNRDGEPAILTRQAPLGYIGIYENDFWQIIKSELATVEFKGTSSRDIYLELQVAIDNASQKIASLISSHAPIDSGELKSQISLIDSDSSEMVEAANSESGATLVL